MLIWLRETFVTTVIIIILISYLMAHEDRVNGLGAAAVP